MEIEKKYLCTEIPFQLQNYTVAEIEQSYISVQPIIRLRKHNTDYFLTVKGKGAIVREEFELPLSAQEYYSLLKKAETPKVLKTRYFIPLPNHLTAELDVYKGVLNGLITVEVEFPTIEATSQFTPPQWFGLDISKDHRYKNVNLAQYGKPTE